MKFVTLTLTKAEAINLVGFQLVQEINMHIPQFSNLRAGRLMAVLTLDNLILENLKSLTGISDAIELRAVYSVAWNDEEQLADMTTIKFSHYELEGCKD